MTHTQAQITKTLVSMGLSLEATFIPWSQSRNRDEKTRSINWIVTLKRLGKRAVTTDYMQGIGHIPGYDYRKALSRIYEEDYHRTCETGKTCGSKRIPKPTLVDVVYAFLLDSEGSHHPNFEEWADECGYDPDSRTAERIYQDCVKITIQFHQMFTESERETLRELFQDY